MSESVTLKSYFYEVLIPSSQKNTSSPIEDILHHVSKYIFYEKACALQMFQSTHPHGVRQSLRPSATLFHVVSIHAPTRGATSHDCYSPFSVSCFNPRTHTGCDLVVLTSSNNLIIVSIHAPTRGATFVYRGTDRPQFCRFNPRTHTGCDVM